VHLFFNWAWSWILTKNLWWFLNSSEAPFNCISYVFSAVDAKTRLVDNVGWLSYGTIYWTSHCFFTQSPVETISIGWKLVMMKKIHAENENSHWQSKEKQMTYNTSKASYWVPEPSGQKLSKISRENCFLWREYCTLTKWKNLGEITVHTCTLCLIRLRGEYRRILDHILGPKYFLCKRWWFIIFLFLISQIFKTIFLKAPMKKLS
jgi:hypothetical protein